MICSFPSVANFSSNSEDAFWQFFMVICPFDFFVSETSFSKEIAEQSEKLRTIEQPVEQSFSRASVETVMQLPPFVLVYNIVINILYLRAVVNVDK